MQETILYIVAFIVVFSVVVTVHEFGHFIVAKRSGILCQEFAIGMGPKIFHKKIGETNFTIRLLPVGGYVKMPDNVFDFNNDVSPYDLKRGMKILLQIDSEDKVQKIILDKSNNVDLVQIELSEFDLTEKLFIEGFTSDGQELEKFYVNSDACVVFSGMEEQIAPINRMFSSHSPFKKFMTLFAGPLMNFLLALFIFIGLSIYTGVPNTNAIVGKTVDNSPAQMAGLKTDDVIKEIDGAKVSNWNEMGEAFSKTNGKEVTLKVERNNKEEILKITPKEQVVKDKKGNEIKTYKIGIEAKYDHNILKSIINGFERTLYYGTIIFYAIVRLFSSLFTGSFNLNQLGGPVAIYEITSQTVRSGFVSVLNWIGLLSVNVGLMNLIPIPVLDGGRIVFVTYEAIFGRPISKRAQYYVTAVFGVLMILLMLLVTWNDIHRLFNR